MPKSELLKGLERGLGASKVKREFDPELFMLRFKNVIVENQKVLNGMLEKAVAEKANNLDGLIAEIKGQRLDVERLVGVYESMAKTMQEHKIERVEVEKTVVVPAPVVNVHGETEDDKNERRGWFEKAFEVFKAPADTLMALFEKMRSDPKYAIGVKLTTASGESFYNAVLTAIAGGQSQGLTDAQLRASPVPISGTVTVNVITGFATETTLALVKAKTDNLDIALSALRDALRGGNSKTLSDIVTALASVPVTGTFWQATQPVSGTFWQTTQPVKQIALPLATNTTSTLTLTSASTAYQITEPNVDFLVTYCNNSDTDMYWGFATLTTGGILLAKTGGTITFLCGANNSPFFYCASAGKVLNYTTTAI